MDLIEFEIVLENVLENVLGMGLVTSVLIIKVLLYARTAEDEVGGKVGAQPSVRLVAGFVSTTHW